jgi:hypothetical protein
LVVTARETGAKVETHLPAEYRARTRTGAVCLEGALFEDMAHQVEILLHALYLLILHAAL